MNKPARRDNKPWEPVLDTLPVFNAFVSPIEHLGDPMPAFPAEDAAEETVEAGSGVELRRRTGAA